jgi:hypothetical protein
MASPLAVSSSLEGSKHFHELKRPPTDNITKDRFAPSLKMSMLYFAV